MTAHIYCADIWCESCARDIKLRLVKEALATAGLGDTEVTVNADGTEFYLSVPATDEGFAIVDRFIESDKQDLCQTCGHGRGEHSTREGHLRMACWATKECPCLAFVSHPPIIELPAGRDLWGFATEQSSGIIEITLYQPDDEHQYDSGEWPKDGPDGGGEADSPQNCGGGEECLGNPGAGNGMFLENPLTQGGYREVKSMLDEHGETLPPAAQEWADYYGFSYHKGRHANAHEWFSETVIGLSSDDGLRGNPAASTMHGMLVSMGTILDEDQIQLLFQEEMAEDGYFDKPGWRSDEMEDDNDR